MTTEQIVQWRLAGHHLLEPSEVETVVKDLCGLQAQFLSHALYGLQIRCGSVSTDGLIKSWTNRGTMHIFSQSDLPLFFHKGRTHFLRPVDSMDTDAFITAKRKAYFADLILTSVAAGICQRDALKAVCMEAGLTEGESKSVFDPWGGIIRALCQEGKLCHMTQQHKAYRICPPFEPMEEQAAWLEMACRYFLNFGPATVKDAAYFFGTTQSKVRSWLQKLPVSETEINGKTGVYIRDERILPGSIPKCLLLGGFDQLMLGYEKTESLLLHPDHMRKVFSLSGIVRPTVLINGRVAGCWNKKNRKLNVMLFQPVDQEAIREAAQKIWGHDLLLSFELWD